MRYWLIAGLVISSVEAFAAGALPNYFDPPAPSQQVFQRTAPVQQFRQAPAPVPVQQRAAPVQQRTVEQPAVQPPVETRANEETDPVDLTDGSSVRPSNTTTLSPELDQGLQNIETGMEELRSYGAAMANHIRRNGLRGFFNTPPELQAQGRSIGQTIGQGIRAVANETARDMTAPQSVQ